MEYDVAIIGLGPAGIEFAKEALKKGLKVIAFEKSFAGGTCLNVGCVPTKTMLRLAEVFSLVKNSNKFSIELNSNNITFSYPKMVELRTQVVAKLQNALVKSLLNMGLEIVPGEAEIIIDGNSASILNSSLRYDAKNIIVSTGSCASCVPGLEFNHDTVLNSDDLLKLQALPKSILIIGSGAIGLEWACILNSLGVEVSVIELANSLAPNCDIDISARVERIFKMRKIKFYKNTTLKSFDNSVATLSGGCAVNCEKILCAIGRVPLLPKFTGNFTLKINPDCTTNISNLFVTGDARGSKMLAHAATFEARALFKKLYCNVDFKISQIPSVIYLTPEIASIGIREQDIQNLEDREQYKITKIPVSYLAKSWCDAQTDGFIKLILKDNFIAGAHIVSNEASALITQIAIAMKANLTSDELCDVVFPHPSYSEGIWEALNNV